MESNKHVYRSRQESIGALKHARNTLAGEPGKGGKAQKVAHGRAVLSGKYGLK